MAGYPMTPARLAEIRRYIQRLDLDRPPLTEALLVIRDLWAELPQAWDEGLKAGRKLQAEIDDWYDDQELDEMPQDAANPYRDGERQ
jgi:hypothetical protein